MAMLINPGPTLNPLSGLIATIGSFIKGGTPETRTDSPSNVMARYKLQLAREKSKAALDNLNKYYAKVAEEAGKAALATKGLSVRDKLHLDMDAYFNYLEKLPEPTNTSSRSKQPINWNNRFEDMKKKYQDKLYYLDMKGVDFSSADALQRSLNEKFKTNLVVDNKWGNKSQAALDLILANIPGEESQLTLNPIPVAPQQVQVASSSPFANISNPRPVNLDRGDIRSIFRHYGYDPYQFTGSQRKSFRKWLGGDRTQNIDFIDRNSNLYLDWVAPYTVFQSSAVDRFRRGGIVRKFQEGNKFNFIKAEDIFKKTTDAIKELDKKILQVKKAASLPKKKSNNKVTTANTTAQLLLALYNAGMFDGIKKNGKQVTFEQAVDGIKGNLTNQAIKNALKAGYNVDTNAGLITKKEKTKLFPEKTVTLSSIMSPFSKLKDELQKAIQNDQTYTEIDPRDYKEFGQWLYNEGASHSIGNAFNTAGALTKNFLGLGNNINLGEGAQQQAIALHLFDDHNKIKTEDGIKHIIDKDKNGDYRWQLINGGENVHNDRSIFSKALSQPGMHILGQYTTFESPEGYRIIDTYNFNKPGTDYAKNKINSDKSTSYDYLRYQAGEYGQNKDLKIDLFIPKEKVLNWYNEFKSGKGVAERTKNILNEYNNKGYVGSGRQTYL